VHVDVITQISMSVQ